MKRLVILVALAVNVAALPPMRTLVTPAKLNPSIVIEVPPAFVPDVGLSLVMDGCL